MVRVELPFHLRKLAHVDGEVSLDVAAAGATTQRALVDAIEARYPMLRGTIRDYATDQRRAYLRFFACCEDVSFGGLDQALPEAVLAGREPFMIVGALSGG